MPPPKRILVDRELADRELLEEALTERAGRKVAIEQPQRGARRKLMEQAQRNAEEALDRRMAETTTQGKILRELADTFELPDVPKRIEVYDNSHIMGTNATGAMIVAGPEGFRKNSYRKFNIKRPETQPGDDFAMMREVLERRFARLEKEDPDRQSGEWPDLLLIDGGKGQLSAVCEVMEDMGVHDVPIVAVSKGPRPQCEGARRSTCPAGANDAAAQFGTAVLPPAAARRGAPLRHRHAPRQAGQEPDDLDARRGPGHRPQPQARAADALRHGAGGQGRGARRPRESAGHQPRDGAPAL